MPALITIENTVGDIVHFQLDAKRVQEALNAPVWFQFLMEELVSASAVHNVGIIEMLPLGTELTTAWLATEGNELLDPPLQWKFHERLAHALQYEEHPLIRIEADTSAVLVRRCLNDWFGDGNGPMVVAIHKATVDNRVDMTLV